MQRNIFSMQGAQDTIIPSNGGRGAIPGFSLVSDTDSIYAYAKAFGYTGAQLPSTEVSISS